MRLLRTTLYFDPAAERFVTTVLRECDLTDTLESARVRYLTPGALIVSEIFEMEGEPSVEEATVVGAQRHTERLGRERDQAVLYYWLIFQWERLRPGSVILMDRPAPLSREEMAVVLEQLAMHPGYKQFRIVGVDQTEQVISLNREGKIEDPDE